MSIHETSFPWPWNFNVELALKIFGSLLMAALIFWFVSWLLNSFKLDEEISGENKHD